MVNEINSNRMQSSDLTSLAASFEKLSLHPAGFFTTKLGKIAKNYIHESSEELDEDVLLQSACTRFCCGKNYALMIAANRHLQDENSPISFTADQTEIVFFQVLEILTTRRYMQLYENNMLIKKIEVRSSFSIKMQELSHYYLQKLGSITTSFRTLHDPDSRNFQDLFYDILRKAENNFIECGLFYAPPHDNHSICILSIPHYVLYDTAGDKVQWYFEKTHLIQALFNYIQAQKEKYPLLCITLEVFERAITSQKRQNCFTFLSAEIFGIIGSYLELQEVQTLQREAAFSSEAPIFLREEFTTNAYAGRAT